MTEQALYNLLYNARLYTGDPARISVSARCYADVLEIRVEDNGPGFPRPKQAWCSINSTD